MKTKIFTLTFASIFALVLLISGISATSLSINETNIPSSVNTNAGSFTITFNLINNGSETDINWAVLPVEGTISSSSFNVTTIGGGSSTEVVESVKATINFPAGQTGNIAGTITANGSEGYKSFAFSVPITSSTSSTDICAYDDGTTDNDADLKVNIKDISVVSGFGKDKEWLPLDEVEVEIKVENNGDYDVKDISLEWAIADKDNLNNDFVVDFDEIDNFKLKENKDDTFTVTFRVDEKDLDMDFDEFVGNDYDLIVRATGEIYGNAAEDDGVDGDLTCAQDSEEISFEEENNFVILDKIDVQPTVSCGDELQISADVWNIGSDDQDDVTVKIYNKELGISELKEFSSIDSYESEPLGAFIKIPKDAEEKTYILTFEVYDEDNDIYQDDYDDDDSRFTATFDVSGGCGAAQDAIVSASITSGGEAGQPLVITATITNTGDESATYNVNAAGFAGWADSVDVSPKTFILDSGDSKDVTFTFEVMDDASGVNTFNIEVLSENKLVITQPVEVSISKPGFGFGGVSTPLAITGGVLIVLILVTLVILIIKLAK